MNGEVPEGVDVKLLEDGEICVRSSAMSAGYFNNEEETKKNFIDGWYYTGIYIFIFC